MGFLDPLLIAFSYLCGAIPFGYLIAKKYYFVDIREHGSGNTGATNVWRTLGTKPGAITLALDIFKGFFPIVITKIIYPRQYGLYLLCGTLAIVGHNWSIFLKGRGGKGVATSAGVFLALLPKQCLVAIAMFCGLFYWTGFVSVGSIGAALTLMLATLLFKTPVLYRFIVFLAGIMLIVKHIPNIKRLLRGEEPKVNFR